MPLRSGLFAGLVLPGLLAGLAPSVRAEEAPPPLALSGSPSDDYTESFSFVADLDGAYVQVELSVTNLGPGAGHAFCHVLVSHGDDAPWQSNARSDSDAWGYDAATRTLRMGPCSITQSRGNVVVRAELSGGLVVLSYDGVPNERSDPQAEIREGAAMYQSWILFDRAPVRATLRVPGATVEDLVGGGYADHSRSELAPAVVGQRWVRFRALRDDAPTLLLAREAPDGTFGPAFWQAPREPRRPVTSYDVRRQGTRAESRFDVVVHQQDGPDIELHTTGFLGRHAPVEELGFLGRLVKPFVGSPVTYTLRARLERVGAPPVDGVLEVSLDAD